MIDNKRIIILASERSGTNLLRVLLNNHKDICGPIAPHFFNTFYPTLSKYGDLENKQNSLLLLNHMIRLANHKFHDWKFNINVDEIIEKYNVNSYETAFDAVYQERAMLSGKKHYVSKDNDLFNYIEYINKLENVKYLYLYRDPRDHVASWMQTPIFMHTPFDVINKWIKEQNTILDLSKTNSFHFVSYEDLISNSKVTMDRILKFIEVDIDENCYTTDPFNKESKRNELWKNLSKPILKNNTRKYQKLLSRRDIKIIESKSKHIMKKLGYDFDTLANWKPYRGFIYELMLKRKISEKKNKKLKNVKMADLQDKFDLIKTLSKELK